MSKIVLTAGVNNEVANNSRFAKFVLNSLARFSRRDWGDTTGDDAELNDDDPHTALVAYTMEGLKKIWIKSDDYGSGRYVLTVLFPDEW